MTERTRKSRDDDVADEFVNYMPGMPRLSSDPGRIEACLTRLFRRRGPLRLVFRDRSEE